MCLAHICLCNMSVAICSFLLSWYTFVKPITSVINDNVFLIKTNKLCVSYTSNMCVCVFFLKYNRYTRSSKMCPKNSLYQQLSFICRFNLMWYSLNRNKMPIIDSDLYRCLLRKVWLYIVTCLHIYTAEKYKKATHWIIGCSFEIIIILVCLKVAIG